VKGTGLVLGLVFGSAVAGTIGGNAALWATAFATTGHAPRVAEVSLDRVAASFGGMLGAGLAGFGLGSVRRRPDAQPG
jgi:hypothetical protein